MRINPVTNDPYVTLFHNESEAIQYARRRAYQTGPARGRGNIYFVVHTLPYEGDKFGRRKLSPKYRVLRGSRGRTQTKVTSHPRTQAASHPYPLPQEFQEEVMVFNNNGVLPNGKIQWRLNKRLTIPVRDVELEQEKARELKAGRRVP